MKGMNDNTKMMPVILDGNNLNGAGNSDDYCFQKTENHRSRLYGLITG